MYSLEFVTNEIEYCDGSLISDQLAVKVMDSLGNLVNRYGFPSSSNQPVNIYPVRSGSVTSGIFVFGLPETGAMSSPSTPVINVIVTSSGVLLSGYISILHALSMINEIKIIKVIVIFDNLFTFFMLLLSIVSIQ